MGLLGTRASTLADLILLGSLLVLIGLSIGVALAMRGHYEGHRWLQTGAVGLNVLLVIGMISSLLSVDPSHNVGLRPLAFTAMPAHEAIGALAVLFGSFVVLRGHGLVPKRLQFSNYKRYMRIAYALYLAATLLGVAVYLLLYT